MFFRVYYYEGIRPGLQGEVEEGAAKSLSAGLQDGTAAEKTRAAEARPSGENAAGKLARGIRSGRQDAHFWEKE